MKKLLLRKVKVLGKGYIGNVSRSEHKPRPRSSDTVSSTLSLIPVPPVKHLKVIVTDLTKVAQLVFLSVSPNLKT